LAARCLHRSEQEAIWALQGHLAHAATTPETLAERLHLAQRWQDLLILEGVSFFPTVGVWNPDDGDYTPWTARAAVNAALFAHDLLRACRVLDNFLRQCDLVSRRWFADQSPANIRDEEWLLLDELTEISHEQERVVMRGRAGTRAVALTLTFPCDGGFRLHAASSGYFSPPVLWDALTVSTAASGSTVACQGLTLRIVPGADWSITVAGDAGAPARWALRRGELAFRFADDGDTIIGVDLRGALAAEEEIRGFGERFDGLNRRGHVFTLWQLDAWEALIYTIRNQAYKQIPFWHSSRGYSTFWNTSYRLRADIGHADPARYRLTANGPIFDLYVWPAPPLAALQSYTALTGKPLLPPRWAFEPWMGCGHDRWRDGKQPTPALEMIDVVQRFAALDIPHSAIYAEGPGSADAVLFAALAPRHLRALAWGRSQIFKHTYKTMVSALPVEEFPSVRRANGDEYNYPPGHPLAPDYPYLDFSHPRALEFLRAQLKKIFDLGIAGSMIDFGDVVPEDGVFADGSRGDRMHNWYAYGYHQAYQAVYSERRGDDHVLFSRGAAPGSQAFLCQFAGDHQTNFLGMSAALSGGLSIAACGFPFWGSDIGGYWQTPDEEVYVRWIAWGAFSPLMRFHGTEAREPWFFSERAVQLYQHYAWVRENLLDYVYSAAMSAHLSGEPMMRALPLAFPDEPQLAACDDAYMFGQELLVAPMHAGGATRAVNFPTGRWTHLWSGATVAGGGTREVAAPLAEIPVYLCAGALLPVRLHPGLMLGESMSAGHVAALMATPPHTRREATCWEASGEASSFVSTPQADGFTLELYGRQETLFLLLYGLEHALGTVTVNGETLAELHGAERDTLPPGWYAEDSRVVVRLPSGQQRVVRVSYGSEA
jgi:hypothetical protein